MRVGGLVVVAALVMASVSAGAKPKGTHFIFEGEGGIGLTDAARLNAFGGASLGYGGKLGGFPVRFYLVFGYSHSSADDTLANSISYADLSESEDVLTFGPRMYIPVAGNVRLFLQATGGFAWISSDWRINDVEQYSATEDSMLATELSGGVQARVARWLSLGVGVQRVSFWGDRTEATAANFAGFYEDDDNDQFRCLAMAAVHF